MITEEMKIARKFAGSDMVIFNDRLVDGTRSIKVWGLDYEDVQRLCKLYQKSGFPNARVKHLSTKTPRRFTGSLRRRARIHTN